MVDWEEFEAFWKKFPRREARADARKAWAQTSAIRPALAQLLLAIERQTLELNWCKDRRQFIPLPATWLRGERWADDFDVPDDVLPAQPAKRMPADPMQALRAAALAAWAEVRAANASNQAPLLWGDPRTLPTLRAMGGMSVVRDLGPHNAKRIEQSFVEAFCAVQPQQMH